MGAAAFIIAENLGVSYLTVCLAAALPAVLYFLAILFSVHQESVRQGIQGLPPEEIPNFKQILITRGYLILPLFIIVVMLILGFSPAMAGFSAVLSAILLSYIKPESRLTPKRLFEAFAEGAKGAMEVLIACAVVGFIIGSFTLSGLGLKLATLVVTAGGGYLFLTLIFTAIACILLGMGVPTTANYVMMSMITVPAVIHMGVPIMAAHMFCFYYGIISDLTPPVALGSLAGAGIAGGRFWPTAFEATKLAAAAYIVPFFFVYNPILLLGQYEFTPELLIILPFTVFGVRLLSSALYNYLVTDMKLYERILILTASLLCIHPDILWSFIGLGIAAGIYLLQKQRIKNSAISG
jgi:TRAP transporter 4TM/12TM fusion protein